LPPAALILACLVAGCGQSADRDRVAGVVTRFLQAAQDDAGVACQQLSDAAVTTLEQQEQGSCADSVGKLGVRPSPIRSVELYANNAKVDLADGAVVFVEQTADGWRIDDVACRATDGDPRSHPMSCALES
jgi:hypothetical protein